VAEASGGFTGFGIGLRPPHYDDVLSQYQRIDFVEVISENFMVDGGKPLWVLDQVRERLPIALHGVSMGIGSARGLDLDYLKRLRALIDRVSPLFVSDHLCWTGTGGLNTHDLLPLPLTREALTIVCENVAVAQDILGCQLLIENPSTYVEFNQNQYCEEYFITEMVQNTGCAMLLDVNNVYVSAANHGFDASSYLAALPSGAVKQIHLAGHSRGKDMLIDTHDAPVPEGVWALYREAVSRFGPVATMIERDADIPPFAELIGEVERTRNIAAESQRIAA
jgi:uncharacterized protein